MRLIDADELKDFFFSETSGTDETIRDLIDKHNLTYLNDVNEDEVMDFARDLIKCVQNVIDTQPTAFNKDKVMERLGEDREMSYADFESYAEYMCIDAEYNDYFYKGMARAMEIVERGGVDD